MPRPFVLGIDCKFYVMNVPRVVDESNPENSRPMPWPADGATRDTYIASFVEADTTRDVTLNLTAATADVTNRSANGWRQIVSAIKEGSVDANIIWEPTEHVTTVDGTQTAFQVLLKHFLDQCPVACLILDGPKEGLTAVNARCGATSRVTGLHADFVVTSFSRGEPIEDAVTADVTIQPALGIIIPEWVDIEEG